MTSQTFCGRLDPEFNPFDEDYLTEILEATALAWARMKQPDRSEIEDRITFRLAGQLLNDSHFKDLPYDVAAQHWLLGLNGDCLGRLDLRFKHRHSQRDYFAFESKRLHVTYPHGRFSSEYRTYVGDPGMMTFITGYYSKALPACGMLAYVMDGKTEAARVGLEQLIEVNRKLLKLRRNCRLSESILSKRIKGGTDGTYLGETKHKLEDYELRLFHLLLPIH